MIQSIHRTQSDGVLWKILIVTLTSTSPIRILNQGRTMMFNHHSSRRLRGHPQDGGRKRSTPGVNFQVLIPPRQQDGKNAICVNKLNLVYVNFRLCYFYLQIFDTISFLCRCAQGIWWLRGIAPDRRSECPSRRETVPCPSFKTSSAPAPSAAGGRA